MANYSPDEIKSFEQKDVRISRLSMLKSLIESISVEEVYDVEKVSALAERYVQYVYSGMGECHKNGRSTDETLENIIPDTAAFEWAKLAEEQGIAIPNSKSLNVLDAIWDEYRTVYKTKAKPAHMLTSIIKKYGKYPTSLNSVDKVVSEAF